MPSCPLQDGFSLRLIKVITFKEVQETERWTDRWLEELYIQKNFISQIKLGAELYKKVKSIYNRYSSLERYRYGLERCISKLFRLYEITRSFYGCYKIIYNNEFSRFKHIFREHINPTVNIVSYVFNESRDEIILRINATIGPDW